jgi:class 3 adenylate cyclase/tetratricopeptide (TPR) repeat protein
MALGISCTVCGTELRAGSKFCDNCGESVALVSAQKDMSEQTVSLHASPKRSYIGSLTGNAVLEHERKQVTVLFADIKGSTELVADRDPDDARRLLDPILERMMEAVHLYEGTVHRVMGDGIMALFGAPVAYEDHALRACYSALKMQELVKKYAEPVRRTEGFALQIRVGLNSGDVAAGAVGGNLPLSYSVNGQPVHLAARMEQLATPGTILMAAQTFHLTEGYLTTKALGPMVVKGLPAPVETYELLGASALRSRLQVAAAHGLSPFVGRQNEIARLREARDQAWAGHGQVVGIVGEPGVGKSRLFHEFIQSQTTSAWRILETGAVSYGAAASYLPVTEFLRGYFQITPSDEPAVVREKVTTRLLSLDERLLSTLPALLMLLDLPQKDFPSSTVALPQRRRGALDAVKRLLFRESEVQPLLIMLEDLHTVDPDTQALIDGLVDSLPTARILLVASYRPEYRHGWGGKTYYTQIRIDPLNTAGAEEMLSALVGDDSALDPLRQLLLEKTSGNPLFLEESVRALVENGALNGKPGAYSVTKPVSDLKVPATVESLLASRIDRLLPADKRLLQCAAVIGHHVPLRVLQAVQGLPGDELRHGIERLQTSEFLYETRLFPDLEYTFKHALIHDVAYNTLPLDRRRALHTAALIAGEQLDPDQTLERAEWLAFHAFRGEVWDRAVSYLRSAAARAIARAANRLAVQHLENALIAAGHLSGEESAALEVDLRIDLRHALTPLGEVQRTLGHLRAAEALVTEMGDRPRLGRIVSFTANCLLIHAQHAEALATGARALAIAQELHDGSLEVATRIYMARARLARGECREAIEMLQETIRLLNEKPADDFLGVPVLPAAYARSVLATSLAEVGDFHEAAAHAAEASRRAGSSGQPDSILWANWSVGLVAMLQGASEDAVRVFDHLYELCRTHDLDAYTSRVMAGLGCARARLGLVEEGLQLLERAVAMDAAAEPMTTRSFALNALAEALFLGGEEEGALAACNQALQFTREHDERGAEAYTCFLLGLINNARISEFEAAAGYLRAAASIASDYGLRPLLAHCQLGLAEWHRKRGDTGEAREYLERGRSMLNALGMKQWFRLDREAASGTRSELSA